MFHLTFYPINNILSQIHPLAIVNRPLVHWPCSWSKHFHHSRGTEKIMALCHRMKRLDSCIHVSTAYANCDRDQVLESVYPPPVDYQKWTNLVDWMDDSTLEKLTPSLLGMAMRWVGISWGVEVRGGPVRFPQRLPYPTTLCPSGGENRPV
jgi:hypothetical protein